MSAPADVGRAPVAAPDPQGPSPGGGAGGWREEYPDAVCELDHENPFQLLVATILSAQTTDVRVNMVTPALFARYPTPEDLAGADLAELEEIVRSTGLLRQQVPQPGRHGPGAGRALRRRGPDPP